MQFTFRIVTQLLLRFCRQLSRVSNAHEINDVVIVSAVRTPICSFQSRLAALSAPRLGALAIDAAIKQSAVPHECVHDVYMGNALSAGIGQAPARQAALFAGLPKGVCCTTVNKVCASGMKAITLAAQALQLGHIQVALAGGMESMSNVPYYLERGAIPYGGTELSDGLMRDALSDFCTKVALVQYAESEAQRLAISQAELDTYAALSLSRATQAARNGAFLQEIMSVHLMQTRKPTDCISEDEELDQAAQPMGKCAVSPLNDGAAALVLTTQEKARALELTPLARIVGYQDVEMDAEAFATAPAEAVTRLLQRLQVNVEQVARWEINDDVAVLPLAFMKQLQVPIERVNLEGSALALGHPIGMSGARLVTHLAHSLRRSGDLGCAAICDGDGGASAILIEKLGSVYYESYPRPLLTLYTRDPCPLCDILVEELQQHFGGEYLLEKIDITDKQHLRFLRLYRHDIPVLFWNGQFLCMHRLNHALLRRKMDEWRDDHSFY